MGTSKRDDLYKVDNIPGPGTYNTRPTTSSGPKFGFGTSKRDDDPLQKLSKTLPGPGAYSLKSEFEKPGHGTTLVGKRPDTSYLSASRIPGPGAYDPKPINKQNPPAYRMGTAPRDSISKESLSKPGPGNYDPKLITSKGGIRFGSSTRKPLNDPNASPGPGSYNIPSKMIEGPKCVITSRKEDPASKLDRSLPGPGQYTPSINYIRERAPAFGIGSGNRSDLYKTGQAPGPGHYNLRGRSEGPKWGFGTSRRNPLYKTDTSPGPGAYNIPPKFADVPKYAFGSSPLKIHL